MTWNNTQYTPYGENKTKHIQCITISMWFKHTNSHTRRQRVGLEGWKEIHPKVDAITKGGGIGDNFSEFGKKSYTVVGKQKMNQLRGIYFKKYRQILLIFEGFSCLLTAPPSAPSLPLNPRLAFPTFSSTYPLGYMTATPGFFFFFGGGPFVF